LPEAFFYFRPSCSRDETVTATVIDDARAMFAGEVMSLSGAALKAVRALGYQWRAVSGLDVWIFDGETLDERRRIEAESCGGGVERGVQT
jgi:hypothetical protein